MPPIKPSQLKKDIPESVFDCFNELINKHFDGHSAVVPQQEVVALHKAKNGDKILEYKFQYSWLDVENDYRDAGWDVQYEKPGYNEPGDAYFTFTPKKSKLKNDFD